MDKINFTRDGWRGIIASDFTIANVSKVAYAIARWLNGTNPNASAVIGYDCRFGGEMFLEAIAKILASKGIQVYISERFVSSAMISVAVTSLKADCGISISASYFPPEYNGLKLKGKQGGPMPEKDLKNIELLISEYEFDLEMLNWNYLVEQGKIQHINFETIYHKHLMESFDLNALEKISGKYVFDAMFGSTQSVFKKILPNLHQLNCELNPNFKGITPVPVQKNLHKLEQYLTTNPGLLGGFAVDGDGERLAMYDENGNYIDANHILLIIIYILAEHHDQKGTIVASFTATSKIEKLCKHYKLDLVRSEVGLSNIAKEKRATDVLVGGDDTGCIILLDNIESDGIFIALQLYSWMIKINKSLGELIDDIQKIVGDFWIEQLEMEINRKVRSKILEKCADGGFSNFKQYQVLKVEELDGYKFCFDKNKWVLIRASAWFPVLRIYAEAENQEQARELLHAVQTTINEIQ
ncbi:MAG: hypothetical protein MI922_18210 [Bacteroidales bacterium]|nr:hypothetical protein [Bacteroidales bacterium]